ncbi:MAG: hypothetical protein ACI88H_002577 [Cocleimonas sp.]|jgi:hypothetical protein
MNSVSTKILYKKAFKVLINIDKCPFLEKTKNEIRQTVTSQTIRIFRAA